MIDHIKTVFNGIVLNRIFIAVLSALGGVLASTYPAFFNAFCGG